MRGSSRSAAAGAVTSITSASRLREPVIRMRASAGASEVWRLPSGDRLFGDAEVLLVGREAPPLRRGVEAGVRENVAVRALTVLRVGVEVAAHARLGLRGELEPEVRVDPAQR